MKIGVICGSHPPQSQSRKVARYIENALLTQGLCDAAVITLTNGFAVGALAALFLNGLLPADDAEDDVVEEGQHPDGTEPETKKKLLDNEDSEEEKEKSEERPLALEISA